MLLISSVLLLTLYRGKQVRHLLPLVWRLSKGLVSGLLLELPEAYALIRRLVLLPMKLLQLQDLDMLMLYLRWRQKCGPLIGLLLKVGGRREEALAGVAFGGGMQRLHLIWVGLSLDLHLQAGSFGFHHVLFGYVYDITFNFCTS